MKKIFLSLLSLFISLFGFSLAEKIKAQTAWQIQEIEKTGYEGKYTSLALDSKSRPHLSYYESNAADLKYAYFDGNAFQIQTVDNIGDVGKFSSLAIDSNDRPHISYYDATNGDLKYAYHDGASWQFASVDTSGNVGTYTSLALDQQNKAHISYYDQTNKDLKYAYYSGPFWQTQTIDSATDVGEYTDLSLNQNGQALISYYDKTNKNLKFYNGSLGIVQTVDTTDDVGKYSSLAIDLNSHFHISYYDSTNNDLKYAFYDGSTWQSQAIDVSGDVGKYSSLALNNNDQPFIFYFDATGYHLKYLYFNGTNWQGDYLNESVADPGYSASLALDSTNFRPHLSYFNGLSASVKYALYDDLAPSTSASPSSGKYKTNKKISLSSSDNSGGSGVDKIYYTTDGSTPTTFSSVYGAPILITRDTLLQFFAQDKVGNSEQVKKENYKISKAKFKTKNLKEKQKYEANNFYFLFSKLPKKLKAKKYYLEIERFKKYPPNFAQAKSGLLKKYWRINTNLDEYPNKDFEVKLVFKYKTSEFKNLKKRNRLAQEKNLHLLHFDSKTKTWKTQELNVSLNQKKNSLYLSLTEPPAFKTILFALGI